MSRRTVQGLAALVVGLALLLVALENRDDAQPFESGGILLPGLADMANDADRVQITRPGDDDSVTLQRLDDRWVVGNRHNYPADMGTLRKLIAGLAEARIVEEKTSNPDRYERLGVGDPGAGGGTRVDIYGSGIEYGVIVGNSAGGDMRYVRPVDRAASYLIDRDPGLPDSVNGWLATDIVNIGDERIRRVAIEHADGETIQIEKSDAAQTDFVVIGIPEGRELGYASIGNGIAGALNELELDDVRRADNAGSRTTARFETFDGLVITANVDELDNERWVSFTAGSADDAATSGEADAVNARLSGWAYRLPASRANLLTRRWDDLLKTDDDAG